MKKKQIVLMLAVLIVVSLLTACLGSTTTPTRGTWENRVFTSEYLGLRFVLPATWEASTDLQISVIMGVAESIMGAAGTEIPEDIEIFRDMVASNPLTGANVQFTYQNYGRRTPTANNLMEAVVEGIEAVGGRVIEEYPGTTRIGAYDWHSFGTELDMMGTTVFGRQFFNIHQGYVRIIVVTYMSDSEPLEEIMSLFIGLDDPLPEISEAEHAEELLDTSWYWDANDDYTYVFNADGTGTRGFSGAMEQFEWRTDANSLIIVGTMMVEGWTFSISGDVLTLNSLQTLGLSLSYIRSGADGADITFVPPSPAGSEHAEVLVGTWDWDTDDSYTYIFNADGTGTRGFTGEIESFEWATEGDDHLIIGRGELAESWTFTIADGVLTIDSRQIPGMTFNYIQR